MFKYRFSELNYFISHYSSWSLYQQQPIINGGKNLHPKKLYRLAYVKQGLDLRLIKFQLTLVTLGRGQNSFLKQVGLFKGRRLFHHFIGGLCNISLLLTNSWRCQSPGNPGICTHDLGSSRKITVTLSLGPFRTFSRAALDTPVHSCIVLYCIYTFIQCFWQCIPIRSASRARYPERREHSEQS